MTDTPGALLPNPAPSAGPGRPAGADGPVGADGPGARNRRDAVRRAAPLLPVLAVVALLAVPVTGPAGDGAAGSGTPADAASALLVVFCLLRAVRERARPLTRTAALVLGLPVFGVCVAAITAADAHAALPGLARYLQVFVLVPGSLLLLLRDRRDFRLVTWAVVAGALAQGAVGTVQYVTGTGASYMGEDVRAVGTFGPTDVMGMATVVSYGLVAAVGLALGVGAHGTGAARGAARRQRAAALGCAALLSVPLVLSFSRGAWIATAVAVTLQLALSGLRRAARVALVAAALGTVLVGGLGVGSQLVTERLDSITEVTGTPDRSVTDRYTMWAAAAGMWRTDPVTGVGLKGFPAHRDTHSSLALSSGSDTAGAGRSFERRPLLSPHNMYLLVLSEQGLLGLLALTGSWGALLVLTLRRLRAARPGPTRGSTGTDCGLVAAGLLVWQLVDFGYADIGGPSTVQTAVVLGLAAWWALSRTAPGGTAPGPAAVRREAGAV
ncbi:O-antigen ligase family protein [Streptomyces sp. NBC_01498]|uniref:O-antigen ligase family protein n=1 Tax=Streptomyces sp. NBC_01498 TaxID=2975870 RepID=UPI002E7B461F|nr:O-antigen ligase family protein [Streptomyces sp. NBC_01498]WTL26369.1 O-antigen ligase family protein [Streptomyces sp. NBC_01498]